MPTEAELGTTGVTRQTFRDATPVSEPAQKQPPRGVFSKFQTPSEIDGFTSRIDGFTFRIDGFTFRIDGFIFRFDGFTFRAYRLTFPTVRRTWGVVESEKAMVT